MPAKYMTADEIMKEIDLGAFLAGSGQLPSIEASMKQVLIAQIDKTHDHGHQIEVTLAFIKALWKKYDCEQVAIVYEHFIKFEEALYGLERDSMAGKRYRDHFIHMFNCYTFGLRLIAKCLAQTSDAEARALFKVGDEDLKALGLPFAANYTYRQRLFYLWTLIATFHDIAIPFQHLTNLSEGVNKYIAEFGWEFIEPSVSMRSFDASHLQHYFGLLARLFGGELEYETSLHKYAPGDRPNHYLKRVLGREFDRNNHGVLSGLCLWKLIEEIFLMRQSSKYNLNGKQFDTYTEYVLEQDVARASLAISLHSLKPDTYPNLFPIEFRQFPLTFILLLADELQEYLRWEGTSIQRDMKFNFQPKLDVSVNKNPAGVVTVIDVVASFALDEKQENYLIEQAQKIVQREKAARIIRTLDEATQTIVDEIKKVVRKKLKFGDPVKLKLGVYKDWDVELQRTDITN